MATTQRFRSLVRNPRDLLALIALLLGLGEFADSFTISFWEGPAVVSILFLAGTVWIRRGGKGGTILVGALCVFELLDFPTWPKHGIGDWAIQIPFVVGSTAGVLLALTVLKQSRNARTAKTTRAQVEA
jgi:hypothetical protein